MPFLRVLRDNRGYETTYLIHWYREGNRQRSRILYIFRTPGGVRVGREPLEPDVRRDIETQHSEIAFDWKAVMADRQVVETGPEPHRPPMAQSQSMSIKPSPIPPTPTLTAATASPTPSSMGMAAALPPP